MKLKFLKISVVVPTYNSEEYIEQNLKSLFDQEYPNLEVILMDGKSTDRTLEIVKSFEDKISIIRSEKDMGQYDAINKGFALSTGDILFWLNSDDISLPWTLNLLNEIFTTYNTVKWICGKNMFLNETGYPIKFGDQDNVYPNSFINKGLFCDYLFGFMQQENMFWRREVWEKSKGLNLNYSLAADYELWLQFSKTFELCSVDCFFSGFRMRSDSRSRLGILNYRNEVKQVLKVKGQYNFLHWLASNFRFLRIFTILFFGRGFVINFHKKSSEMTLKKKTRFITRYNLINFLIK